MSDRGGPLGHATVALPATSQPLRFMPLCPDCGRPATHESDGLAVCGSCGEAFSVTLAQLVMREREREAIVRLKDRLAEQAAQRGLWRRNQQRHRGKAA